MSTEPLPSHQPRWYTRCRRCRRALKTAESMQVGFGPHCIRLVELTPSEREQLNLPGFLDHLYRQLAEGFTPPARAASTESPRPREICLPWARFWLLPDDPPTV